MTTQIGKWGNSLAVRIPGAFAKNLDLQEGTELDVQIVDGALILRPRLRQVTLEKLLEQITSENLHGETDWGPAVGREAW